MAEKFVYYMNGLTKVFPPSKEILSNVNLSFYYGAKIGIIGQNGSGKSTLLKIMAGLDDEYQGEAWVESGRKVGFLSQEPQLDTTKNVKDNVMEAVAETKALLERFNEISMKFGEEMTDDEMNKLMEEQGKVQDKIEAADAWDLDRKIDIAMDALRCPPGDWSVENLSGGEKRRVALCRLLLEAPDLLLLDEPTNHLDAESVAWLERHLCEYKGSVILVTHDRYFLDNVTSWILELEGGKGIPWQGNYSSWLEQKGEKLRKKEKSESKRQKQLKEELDWVRLSPKGRQTKAKARLKAYDELFEKSKKTQTREIVMSIPNGERLGDKVLEVKNLGKAFGEKVLFDDLTFSLPRSGIVGVIGPNGAGKSTLFQMILGKQTPDSGSLELGETVQIMCADQDREGLDDKKSVWEEISGGMDEINLGERTINSRAYVGLFKFNGSEQQKPVGKLSGGERNRVLLAKLIKMGGNVLLLDEPTNDLDMETLQALENAILEFAGCVVVTSHDRWFLDRIATHILACEGESKWVWFEGNYQDYDENRRKRLGIDADQPHRIRYKSLTRG